MHEMLQRALFLGRTWRLSPLEFHGQSSKQSNDEVFTDPAELAPSRRLGVNPRIFEPLAFAQHSAPMEAQAIWQGLQQYRYTRSCITCTSVAESEVTVPGIGPVIGSGVHRPVSVDVRNWRDGERPSSSVQVTNDPTEGTNRH